MEDKKYNINLGELSQIEFLFFPDTYNDFCKAAEFLLRRKNTFILEDALIEIFKNDPAVQEQLNVGGLPIGVIRDVYPGRFIREGVHPKEGGNEYEGVWGWFDLWNDCIITQQDDLYSLFFTYKVRQTDLLQLDSLLDYFFQDYENNDIIGFVRFLKLTLRQHGDLLQPEQTQTINEWIAEKEKDPLSAPTDKKIKGKPKRERDDKITILNQEQTALLIYCLRETKIIMKDEFLNNKEAGQAFYMLTGYSADSIRQNLNKSEMARIATAKNVKAVMRALGDLQLFIDEKIKPEE